jgi:hypothetical protein
MRLQALTDMEEASARLAAPPTTGAGHTEGSAERDGGAAVSDGTSRTTISASVHSRQQGSRVSPDQATVVPLSLNALVDEVSRATHRLIKAQLNWFRDREDYKV